MEDILVAFIGRNAMGQVEMKAIKRVVSKLGGLHISRDSDLREVYAIAERMVDGRVLQVSIGPDKTRVVKGSEFILCLC